MLPGALLVLNKFRERERKEFIEDISRAKYLLKCSTVCEIIFFITKSE